MVSVCRRLLLPPFQVTDWCCAEAKGTAPFGDAEQVRALQAAECRMQNADHRLQTVHRRVWHLAPAPAPAPALDGPTLPAR
ncbi:hypothetical protein RirG_031910 [Rhizophagus irregularis DAOM 197198w]|uniref:Uncharacterized protein n=1 Tax=Rhizophagus irregularis (strain DAOM 197198w) TaxID=1432141 RepID=A0A015K479_RHIIW|nr:hypothetical protein RirG_031910 [Rhizophagus irregularis DAOM 197198w]